MTLEDERTRPPWLSDELSPFPSRWFTTPDGHRMHYVDEGSGPVIVFLHGNPSWSFEFRHLIRELRHDFRCIAVDHVGFGLSSRSKRKEDHSPQAHAGRFSALMDYLDVKDATLYMSDWGVPVGLHFACHQPERVAGLAIANTWCWPVGSDLHFAFFSTFMRSPLGQFLIKRRNFFVNSVMPRAVGVKSALTPEVMDHYRNAQPPGGRHASAALPGQRLSQLVVFDEHLECMTGHHDEVELSTPVDRGQVTEDLLYVRPLPCLPKHRRGRVEPAQSPGVPSFPRQVQ